MDVSHYGYLSSIRGLALEDLFVDPSTRGESTARFTFFGGGVINSRLVNASIIVTTAPGKLDFYYNPAAGSGLDDPSSFARGDLIASFLIRYHCVLNVDTQNPDVGSISVGIDLAQQQLLAFHLAGRTPTLGKLGMRLRGSVSGEGWLQGRDPFRAYFLYGGNMIAAD
jgi:hypothetical protein